MKRVTLALLGACLTLALLPVAPLSSQSDVDAAIRFFLGGGAYCFRVTPAGVALSEETEWTVMVLAGTANRAHAFKIRSLEPGPVGLSGVPLKTSGMAVTGVWRLESSRADFFERFARGIEARTLRARVVTLSPEGLAGATQSARAERYLKFADRGTKVSFDKVPDLTVEGFQRYAAYFPD